MEKWGSGMELGQPIAVGNTAKIYLYKDSILKLFNKNAPIHAAQYEAEKQRAIYQLGLPVPKILDVLTVNGSQAIIMEHIKGKSLGDLFFENVEQRDFYLETSIDIQIKIHKLRAAQLEFMSVKLTKQIHSATDVSDSKKAELIAKLDALEYENKLCHGDFHLFNLISSDNQIYIIDWVDASLGDIRADVYRTYLLYKTESDELAEQYLTLYSKKSGISIAEILIWEEIVSAARLSENISVEERNRLLKLLNH